MHLTPSPSSTTALRRSRDLARRKNSVDKLFFLYTVLCAFSLEKVAEQVLEAPVGARLGVWMLMAALVVTLVPFFHGALRHVHDTFEEEFPPPTRVAALLVAFGLLFVQAFFFYALARAALEPPRFAGMLAALLAVDIVYGLLTGTNALKPFLPGMGDAVRGLFRFLRRPKGRRHHPELTWVYNNVVFLVPLGIVWRMAHGDSLEGAALPASILGLALTRTVADYWLNWAFYFPIAAWKEEKLGAYVRTTYRATVDDEVVELRIGRTNEAMDRVLARHGAAAWAFVTAYNPHSTLLADDENDARQDALAKELDEENRTCFSGQGVPDVAGWPSEKSLLVVGMTRDEARALGAAHGQYAVVCGEHGSAAELVFCTRPARTS